MRHGHVFLWLLPALLVVAGCGGEEPAETGPENGDTPPPAIEMKVETVTLADLMDLIEPEEPRTRPLVINLWANWCPECVAEIPFLVDFQKMLGDKADLVGVSMDFAENQRKHADLAAAVAEVTGAARRLGIGYKTYVADPGSDDAQGWYSYLETPIEVPYTVVFDKDGIHKGAHSVFASAKEAMDWFEEVTAAD